MYLRVDARLPKNASPRAVASVARSLVAAASHANMLHSVPPLYASGVRYRREVAARLDGELVQVIHLAPDVLRLGVGDCKDLCAWRIAELRKQGELARPLVYWRRGRNLWHVQVRRADGSREDPSRLLGMVDE